VFLGYGPSGPSVRYERVDRLVPAGDGPISLLYIDASLDDIKSAVKNSGQSFDTFELMGGSLLYHAANRSREDVVDWLLESGAKPDGFDASIPPLNGAISEKNIEIARKLIEAGADPNLARDGWLSPKRKASLTGMTEMIDLLDQATNKKEIETEESYSGDKTEGKGNEAGSERNGKDTGSDPE
jgi:Ankyrin repeat